MSMLRYWRGDILDNDKERFIEVMLMKYVKMEISKVTKWRNNMMMLMENGDDTNSSDNDDKENDNISKRLKLLW